MDCRVAALAREASRPQSAPSGGYSLAELGVKDGVFGVLSVPAARIGRQGYS
jgi:hypothetical protein